MGYVDGYVLAVPIDKREAYLEIAATAAAVFKDAGAERIVECWGDDVPAGAYTSFPMAVRKDDNETVVFAWIFWPSRAARQVGMVKAMADPRMQLPPHLVPYDGTRMIHGGFEVMLDV
ncbi:MAG: DUF1428 domain-containing protein [Hyphomicrobium aestuarii]|nr:DUF1428 domain-containing protein [Hyphomicrobium aestuarii]